MSKPTICTRCLATKISDPVWEWICPNCHPRGPNYKPPVPVAPTPPDTRLRTYTVAEAAKLLHVTNRTVYTLFNRGLLKRVKVLRRTLVRHDDLVAFLERPPRIDTRRRRKPAYANGVA
jgi:excisionase family DNA binding protein